MYPINFPSYYEEHPERKAHRPGAKNTLNPAFVWENKKTPLPEAQYATETDKPIGTRNPDKYLKEQQDKLWKEMME